MARRVVITGLGIVSPVGCSVSYAWSKIIAGSHGVVQLKGAGFDNLPCKVAAIVPTGDGLGDLNVTKYVTKSEIRTMATATIFSLVACHDALTDANWFPVNNLSKQMTGVCVGMGMVDLVNICETNEALLKGYHKVNPFFIPRILLNMPAGQISIKYGFQGPNHAVSTACATGAHAIGDGFRFIRHGCANVMICGGTEASISPLGVAGFCRLRALSTAFNDTPSKASRPFDRDRDGFVMGEGSAILVLEELSHALSRSAKIYAEVLGYGLSGDGSHLTAPHEDGNGAILAMSRAMEDAKCQPVDITYINAHATSTPLGDAVELKAISQLFGKQVNKLAVSSTKGAHGHLLGAAGNVESLFTALACHSSTLPPTINLENECNEAKHFNLVSNKKQEWKAKRKIALKNSFGFGGTNACLCIGEYIN